MKLALFFLLFFNYAHGDIPQIFKKAKFNQVRYLKSSSLTLKSSGVVYTNEKEEYFWKQEKPFPMETVISKGQFFKIENGTRKIITNPFMENLFSIFIQLANGDTKALSRNFHISQPSENRYILTPSDKLIKKAIKNLNVEGEKYIRRLKLLETSGNSLEINFFENKHNENKAKEKK